MTILEAQAISKTKEKYEDQLLALPNVIGVGIGRKYIANALVNVITIVVFVKVKVPEAMLQPHEVVPKELEGYVTDVIETGVIIAYSD